VSHLAYFWVDQRSPITSGAGAVSSTIDTSAASNGFPDRISRDRYRATDGKASRHARS